MRNFVQMAVFVTFFAVLAPAQTNSPDKPTWWDKYQFLLSHGAQPKAGANFSLEVGANADVSDECGPQSETYITLNPAAPSTLAAGSNEIFRLPMRGYFSVDGGASWGGVDLPLPPPKGANGINFGSDPSLAFDSQGNTFYGYIVVYFSANFGSINGTAVAVARSQDGGATYPDATFFSFEGGKNHFNDKPIITADANTASQFRDNVYIAWDAASGGSSSGGVRLARSLDHGATFTVTRVDNAQGQGRAIGAVPFVGPNGELYVAWNDYGRNTIAFNRSFDGGATFDRQQTIASKTIAFDVAIPAQSYRGALVYPSCDVDRSQGPHRGRLYCVWMDQNAGGNTGMFLSFSDNQGASWSQPAAVGDPLPVDRFNQWLSVDPVTGAVNISFYDTRNDTTGKRYMTDVYLAQSTDGGATWASPNTRVSTVSSNEHDCNGLFPCSGIDYGNQYGDYEGLVAHGGLVHPVWTDSRRQLDPLPSCGGGLAMEEVFTATVESKR